MEQTVGKIYQAICSAMADISAIGKDNKNAQQGFMYRSIDQMYSELHDIMAKHRIFSVPEVIERVVTEKKTSSGSIWNHVNLKVVYKFYTDDGSCVSATVWGEGMDSGDKGSNKALSVAHKYAFIQVFAIPTDEAKDPDAKTPPETVPMKKAEPEETAPTKPGEFLTGKLLDYKEREITSKKDKKKYTVADYTVALNDDGEEQEIISSFQLKKGNIGDTLILSGLTETKIGDVVKLSAKTVMAKEKSQEEIEF